MEYATVVEAITTLGFPICVCAVLFWYIYKQSEQHKEESTRMVEAINKLELKITQLIVLVAETKGVKVDE